MLTAIAITASLMLAQNGTLPTYSWKDGDTKTYQVYGKSELQPYAIGGTLKLTMNDKGNGKWTLKLDHAQHYIVGEQKENGPVQTAVFETTDNLVPTGTGEGALMFGDQLLAILVLPKAAQERLPIFDGRALFVSASKTEGDFVVVTSTVATAAGKSTISRYLDAKTLTLVKAKCESATVTGKITYELKPVK